MKLKRMDLINMYFKFFEEKGHKVIPSASIIPENDASVLFTSAGMHPLVPFLLGEKHPAGKRLVDVQKCLRTVDIDSVGDESHLTFFEMLGNWSLGDYWKESAISWSWEFLTGKDYLNIPKEKLSFSVFKGDDNSPRDEESASAWKKCGVNEDKIYYLSKENNWWELGGGNGPCGPDSEMFYDTGKSSCNENCNPSCSCGKYLEIWNDVFMEFNLKDGIYTPLENKNVDTGMGLERVITVYNNLESVYDIDEFVHMREKIEELTSTKYIDNKKAYRVIMDHMRTSVFVLGESIKISPSNTGSGYILRRLIRRMIRYIKNLNVETSILKDIALIVINDYKDFYKELDINKDYIITELENEEIKFNKTLKDGYKMFNKISKKLGNNIIDGENAFKLFDTFGFPLEFTVELANEKGYKVDIEGFNENFKIHQEKSRTASQGEFKGGLADDSYESVKYHTLAHILLSQLQEMFGSDTYQKGCNITPERLRMDFPLDHKLSEEEKEELTIRVNDVIGRNLDVKKEEMDLESARKSGAEGTFSEKYGDKVFVYTIADISKEICGGPHVKNTSELGKFKIIKEESSSSGVRRIKAILE